MNKEKPGVHVYQIGKSEPNILLVTCGARYTLLKKSSFIDDSGKLRHLYKLFKRK